MRFYCSFVTTLVSYYVADKAFISPSFSVYFLTVDNSFIQWKFMVYFEDPDKLIRLKVSFRLSFGCTTSTHFFNSWVEKLVLQEHCAYIFWLRMKQE